MDKNVSKITPWNNFEVYVILHSYSQTHHRWIWCFLKWALSKNLLNLPMLRLHSSKAQGCKYFWKSSKPCHVGIHWKVLTEFSQMSTHLPGFQTFSVFLHHFVLGKLATSSTRVKKWPNMASWPYWVCWLLL